MQVTVKSTKWYAKFWPPERRKVAVMQAILDLNMLEIEKEADKMFREYIIYGKKPVDK